MSPLTIRVPTRVMKPLRCSERREESGSVEPGSAGARREAHSSSPDLRERRVVWREVSSQESSLASTAASSVCSSLGGIEGNTRVDISSHLSSIVNQIGVLELDMTEHMV